MLLLGERLRRPKSRPNAAKDQPTAAPEAGEVRSETLFQIAVNIVLRISRDSLMLVAAGVAFYAMTAIFPAIAAFVSIYGLFADPDHMAAVGDTLLFAHLPQVIMERCYVAAVSGISTQRPIVEALLDSEGTVLDDDRNPLSLEDARASVERVRQKYQEPVASSGL